jgi:hypothetical protein
MNWTPYYLILTFFVKKGKSSEISLASIAVFTSIDHPEFRRHGPSKNDSLKTIP